jgi:rod shape-determining protein MreC
VGEVRKVGDDWRVKFSMAERDGGYVQMIPAPEIRKPMELEVEEPTIAASPAQGARQ